MDKSTEKKIAIVLVAMALLAGFYFLDLGRFLTLEYLKEQQASFATLYAAHRTAVIGGYMLLYVVATALALPGALVLTLAGGAMFGLMVGTVVVSFASTIGATVACFVSRFLLRDWVQSRFSDRLLSINEGIDRDGLFYLFSLRLVPIFPFFVINLVMGVTRMPLRSYYWVSQLGMLPATVVFVNAGNELAAIDSLGGILSPGLLFSFVLLGLFPIATKKIMAFLRKNRAVSP